MNKLDNKVAVVTASTEGKIDILVNNYRATDVRVDKDLVHGDSDAFFRIVKENLKSVYLPCKAAIPHMKCRTFQYTEYSQMRELVANK